LQILIIEEVFIRRIHDLQVASVENFGHDDIVISDDYGIDHSTKIYFMKREQPSTVKIKELQQQRIGRLAAGRDVPSGLQKKE